MKVAFSNRFVRQYGKLPAAVEARFDKQLGFLLSNLQHLSLQAKKYEEAANVWPACLIKGRDEVRKRDVKTRRKPLGAGEKRPRPQIPP